MSSTKQLFPRKAWLFPMWLTRKRHSDEDSGRRPMRTPDGDMEDEEVDEDDEDAMFLSDYD
jgi:hypothetical protein